ncbi:Armadillo beta-catenin repeat family protein [Seminavis robusta]|uniref:Armadillo beta-catenin repeat family protein n=1 Tax=Seminavis robusta TaxID=568900 RepID=A0A9N8H4W3_9STRA|nr:Armadillo beta-catenin repeat family protein [Seminavis robusta]|eukprot:Sro14_g010520.1 Armadillo beta-catenin repeat family protein (824) ;mRNA; r:72415-74886
MGNSSSKWSRPLPATTADGGAAEVVEEEAVVEENGILPEQAPQPSLSNQERARLEKKVTSALKHMKRYPKSAAIQRQKLGKLRQYVNKDHDNHTSHFVNAILQQNGLSLVLVTMRRHVKNAAIQDHACRVCTLLARQDSVATMTALPFVLTAMKTHKRNTNVQLNGLAALTFWGMDLKDGEPRARDGDSNHKLAVTVVEQNAYPVIFSTMKNYESNMLIQDKALKALVVLTSTDHDKDNRTAFVSATAWRSLQATITNHGNKPKLQLKTIKILRQIATDHPSAVCKRLSVLVLPTMAAHLTDASIQKHGCSLLLLLATTHEPSHAILWKPGGGREAILAAMQAHQDQEDIQKTAILALQRLPAQTTAQPNNDGGTTTTTATTQQHDKNQTSNAINQGMEAMIASLLKEGTSVSTLTNICKALIRLASASHTNKLDIASANGVEGIVAAMKRGDSVDATVSLHRYACQCLTQLAAVEATKRDIVQQALAIPVIVKAITAHTMKSYELQQQQQDETTEQQQQSPHFLVSFHGILLLVRLSQLLANHAKMMPSIPAIVLTMQVHHDRATLQHKAMVVLHKLAARFVKFKKPIIKAGALDAILKAMLEHQDHTHIQRLGCQCLLNLHHAKTTSMWMVQAGTFQVVVRAMARHSSHIGIQLAAIRVIAEMIPCSSWHVERWATQGMQCLVLSIQMHFDNITFQQLALGVLQLSSKQHSRPRVQRELVQAGGIDAVLTCMKDHHPSHVRIQQSGFRTLNNLTTSRRRAVYHGAVIMQNGGWKVIRQAQRVCAEDEFLQRHAHTLLFKLVIMFLLHWFLWLAYHVTFVVV